MARNSFDYDTLDYLIRHLNEYGNTVLTENPKKYIKKLKEFGYICSVKQYNDIYEKTETGLTEKTPKDYVITLIRREVK